MGAEWIFFVCVCVVNFFAGQLSANFICVEDVMMFLSDSQTHNHIIQQMCRNITYSPLPLGLLLLIKTKSCQLTQRNS